MCATIGCVSLSRLGMARGCVDFGGHLFDVRIL